MNPFCLRPKSMARDHRTAPNPLSAAVAKSGPPSAGAAPSAVQAAAEPSSSSAGAGPSDEAPPSEVKEETQAGAGTAEEPPPSEVKEETQAGVGPSDEPPPSEVKEESSELPPEPPSQRRRVANADAEFLRRIPAACRVCGRVTKPPHWGNECPFRSTPWRVQQLGFNWSRQD